MAGVVNPRIVNSDDRVEMPTVMHIMEATAGGTGRHLRELLPCLIRDGWEVKLVCGTRSSSESPGLLKDLEEYGVEVLRIPLARRIRILRDLANVRRIRRHIKDSHPDIIHVHSAIGGGVGRISAALARHRTVFYTPHAYAFLMTPGSLSSFFFRQCERILARYTTCVVAVSDSEARLTPRSRFRKSPSILVVPNGIEISTPPHREVSQGPIRFGYLGRLESQKSPVDLIEFARGLQAKGLNFSLDIAGEGSLSQECRRRSEKYHLSDRVRFLGYVEDARRFYAEIDVFVIASRYEGLPYSVLDAMALELPVIAYSVPGMMDLVVSGETGLLAEPGRPDQLISLALELAQDTSLRVKMGQAGRERVRRLFRLDEQVARLEDAYAAHLPNSSR